MAEVKDRFLGEKMSRASSVAWESRCREKIHEQVEESGDYIMYGGS